MATVVQPASTVVHVFREHAPYHVDVGQVVANKLRLVLLHFDGARRERLLAYHLRSPWSRDAMSRLDSAGLETRAAEIKAHRSRDTDAYCARFGIRI